MGCKGIFNSSSWYRRPHASRRFRWVFCQLEVLRYCFPANLRRTLDELPKSLDETYKRILSEINNANWVHAYRLLQCLTVALRPLRVEELAEVLAFDLTAGGIPKFNANWRWEDTEEAVLSACSSLVSVVIHNGSRVVQFSHFSVKEFLVSNRLASCMEEISQFHIPIEPSHAILAQACLGVLLCMDDHTTDDSTEGIPLYLYAVDYWDGHVVVGNVEFLIKDTLDYFFDLDNPHFLALARLEHPRELLTFSMYGPPADLLRPAGPLYFAAWRGLRGLVERLLTKDPQHVNQLGGYYGTPLHASVRAGHIGVSQLLLAHGADINSRCSDNHTLLYYASTNGRLKTVKWLLDQGAEVDSRERRGETPLHYAADQGLLEVCRILLEHSADVNSRDTNGWTPLHYASRGWHEGCAGVVRLLLDRGADVGARNLSGKTASNVADGTEREQILQLLSQHAERMNERGRGFYG